MSASPTTVKYRYLGHTGLLVSSISLGCMTFDGVKVDLDTAYAIMVAAFKSGVNFFDNAESYASSKAEVIMGQAIQRGIDEGIWTREDLVISTKIFNGSKRPVVPNSQGLSRKHVIEGIKGSLERIDQDYVDVVFCHRPDARTPIEETVRAMNYVIEQGWAFYWGTSQWTAHEIVEACDTADRLGLIRPVTEQPEYHIFERSRVDYDFLDLYKKYNLGLTSWSPLFGGVLTGKYLNGIPEGSRMTNEHMKNFYMTGMEVKMPMITAFNEIAQEIGASLAQFSVAWCASNKQVSTVMVGATSVAQLQETLKAHEFIDKITPEIKQRVDAIVQFQPKMHAVDRTIAKNYVRFS